MRLKLYTLLVILLGAGVSAQQENYKLGTFGAFQGDLGLDFSYILRPEDRGDVFQAKNKQIYFTYGSTISLGHQMFDWLALSGGVRYNYITPKYHLLSWMVQPYFFTSSPQDKEFNFVSLSLGRQFNSSHGITNGSILGLGLGKVDLTNEQLAQKLQLSLEVHSFDDNFWFLSFSYGIVLFSNKNL